VQAIEEACLKIVQEDGPETLTTQRIADIAGVNIASVYQYFPSKEAVLAKVLEGEIVRLAEAAKPRFERIKALAAHSFEDTLVAIIELEASQLARIHQLGSDFYLQYRRSFDIHERINQLSLSQANPSWENWFPAFLKRHEHRLRSDNFSLLGFVARNALQSCLVAALEEDPALLSKTEFREELKVLLMRYLQAD
jgi:AcrR family transcriptional regulator